MANQICCGGYVWVSDQYVTETKEGVAVTNGRKAEMSVNLENDQLTGFLSFFLFQ